MRVPASMLGNGLEDFISSHSAHAGAESCSDTGFFFVCVTTSDAYWKNFCHQIQKHRMRRLRETARFFSFKRNTLILEAPKLRSFPKCVWVKVMSSLTAFRERFELLNNHLSPIPNRNLNDNMLSINSSLSHFEDQGMRFHPGSLRGRKKAPCS